MKQPNYLSEINMFYDWLETNQVPKSAIALWHALMHINNKAGWGQTFTVAVSTLESKTGFKRSELFEARNLLTQKRRINWKQRGGNLCAEYKINFFSVRIADASADTSADTSTDANPTQKHTINKTKLDYTNSSSAKAGNKKSSSSKKSEKQKLKDPPKTQYWQKLVDVWFEYNVEKFGEKPSFAGPDPRHLKKIIELLEKRAAAKNVEWTEAEASKRLSAFFNAAFEDSWLSKNFLLKQLEASFDKIILNQNGKHKQSTSGNSAKGSSIDDIQALKRGRANQAPEDIDSGGNDSSEVGAEWTEATAVG